MADEGRVIPERHLVDLVHDLRTPLTVVTGFADLLQRRPDLPEDQRREYVERIVEASREMRELLDTERETRHSREL